MPLELIAKKIDSLSGAQKRLGQYILSDSTALLLSTSRELGRAVGVSESTVVRFAQRLGYDGFPELKRELQRKIRPRLRAAARMEETISELSEEQNIIAKLIKRDIQLLNETVQSISESDFHKSIEMIWRAQKVFIIGFNVSMALAHFLHFRLIRVKKDVRWLFLTGGSSLLEQLALMEKEDILIAIGFLDVPRETQTALKHARKVGASVLGITDLPTSAMAEDSDVCLYAKRGLHSTVNSVIPGFSLVNALAIALAWTKKADSIKALKDLDNLLETYLP